jgi:hypothetical protein
MNQFLYRLENIADSRPDSCEIGHEIRECVAGIYAMIPDILEHQSEMETHVAAATRRVNEWKSRLPKDSDFPARKPEKAPAMFMPVLQTAKKPLWKRAMKAMAR